CFEEMAAGFLYGCCPCLFRLCGMCNFYLYVPENFLQRKAVLQAKNRLLVMMDLSISNEQEAAVTILFASVMSNGKMLTQAQIEQLSRMLVLSSKFKSSSLNDLSVKALSLQATHGSKSV